MYRVLFFVISLASQSFASIDDKVTQAEEELHKDQRSILMTQVAEVVSHSMGKQFYENGLRIYLSVNFSIDRSIDIPEVTVAASELPDMLFQSKMCYFSFLDQRRGRAAGVKYQEGIERTMAGSYHGCLCALKRKLDEAARGEQPLGIEDIERI
jgi:hypothetical protein